MFRSAIFALGGLIGLASPVLAGYTQINPPTGEDNHPMIFSFIYGGKFTASGYDYTNGTITAHRVDDYVSINNAPAAPGALVGDPGTTDQTWSANYTYSAVDAKFAVNSQNFGYINSSNQYTKVFDQTGWGYQVGENMTGSLAAASGQTIRFARDSNDDHFLMSSLPSDNVDGKDHMVTYEIINNSVSSAAAPIRTWMLFFEDAPVGAQVADFDFNDLVVEVQAYANTAVPEPTTLGLAGLGLLAMRRRRA